MSEDIFRVDFYPKDWLVKTASLTAEERGVYIQIIALIYSYAGPIENDPKHIGGISGCSTRKAKLIIEKLISRGFLQFSDKKITQKRAEKELEIKFSLIKNGRKGGENKAKNNENNDVGSSPNSSSSPSPDPRLFSKILEEFPELLLENVQAFFEFRNSISKPIQKNFIPKIIEDLSSLKKQGEDLNQVLIQSPARGWTSLQPIAKLKGNQNGKSAKREQQQLAIQRGMLAAGYDPTADEDPQHEDPADSNSALSEL